MFGFIRKVFFAGLTILSSVDFLTITPLRCISMTNQECKVRPEIVNINSDEPVLKQVNVVVVVTMSMVHMKKLVLLML